MKSEKRFEGKTVVVTGAAQGIGKETARRFEQEGADVWIIDIQENPCFTGDLADPKTIERFASEVVRTKGKVDILVNNALPKMKGLDECSYEDFVNALKVGTAAPFYLAKLFAPYMPEGSSIINISSSRDRMSQAQTESYAAAKGGISALTHALAASLSGKVRVNSISPGWIDTKNGTHSRADQLQHPAGRVGRPEDIASMVLFLASDEAGFITGENICIDGGMTHLMVYNGDHGWTYDPEEE